MGKIYWKKITVNKCSMNENETINFFDIIIEIVKSRIYYHDN